MDFWQQRTRKSKWIVGIFITAIMLYGPVLYNLIYKDNLIKNCTPYWSLIVKDYAALQNSKSSGEFWSNASEFIYYSTQEPPLGSHDCINSGHNSRFPEEAKQLSDFSAQLNYWHSQEEKGIYQSPPILPWAKIEFMEPLCYGPSLLHLKFYSNCLIGYGWKSN